MEMFATVLIAIGGVILLWLGLSFLFALPVMWLWNWLLPALFGLPVITWTQAWGLSLLCSFLFKSHVTNKTVKQ
jgi:hypothetical protein